MGNQTRGPARHSAIRPKRRPGRSPHQRADQPVDRSVVADQPLDHSVSTDQPIGYLMPQGGLRKGRRQ